jgi:hypothetical protein
MAIISITIKDTPEDDMPVNMTVECEPPIRVREPDSLTQAQQTALLMIEAATKASSIPARVYRVETA